MEVGGYDLRVFCPAGGSGVFLYVLWDCVLRLALQLLAPETCWVVLVDLMHLNLGWIQGLGLTEESIF